MTNSSEMQTDQGFLFVGPKVEKRRKTLKNEMAVVAYHQSGVMVTGNAHSPWYQGAFFAQGTTVINENGDSIADVSLWETVDQHGDVAWGVATTSFDGTTEMQFKSGTGQWQDLTGIGQISPLGEGRADAHSTLGWQLEWAIGEPDVDSDEAAINEEEYEFHDTTLSFHGPHVDDFERPLSTGVVLVVNSQSGVLMSEDHDKVSPRNYATNYDRGTTIKTPEGQVLGDAMLLEDMDPDGDIAWLYHEWWYGEGGGTYEFVGGTGKWAGMSGVGRTLGIVKERMDDHYMLKSEIFWNIDQG